MTVLITLTIAGTDTGPFNLYSNIDGYVAPFETNVGKSALQAGYASSLVPDTATIIRVKSVGSCTNYVDIPIPVTTTTTTTITPPCRSYTIVKLSCMQSVASVQYLDCYGNLQESFVYDAGPTTETFCALQGSVTGLDLTNGCISLTDNGLCSTPTTTTTTSTSTSTSTTTSTTTTTAPFFSYSLGVDGISGSLACADYSSGSPLTYYSATSLANGAVLYQDSSLSTLVPDGYYSNGVNSWLATSGVLSDETLCPT